MSNLLTSLKEIRYTFLLFIFLHIIFFNINIAEWGDSYRILRATEYIQNFSYPVDEKRPPLYSVLLATQPDFVDAVFWGRIIMFIVSLLAFFTFYLLLKKIFPKDNAKVNFGLLLFTLNPVYFYWSIRIMADVFFSLITMISIYLLILLNEKKSKQFPVFLGILSGLAILTRFEGYLLFGSIGLGLLFKNKLVDKDIVSVLKNNFTSILYYSVSTLITILPYLYFRNPFSSSYLEEPKTRTYDLNTLLIYFLSLGFAFGFVSFFSFLFIHKKEVWKFIKVQPGVFYFVLFELLLILAWPAAIPRLFVPIIPFFILVFIKVWNTKSASLKGNKIFLVANLLLSSIFTFGQYFYKLQFLILIKPVFVFVIIFNLISILTLYLSNNKKVFIYTIGISMLLWSVCTVWIHREVYRTIKEVSIYTAENIHGRVAYNDINSVADWYLNYYSETDNVDDFFYRLQNGDRLSYDDLMSKDIDYIIITSEPFPGFSVSTEKRSHLIEVFRSSDTINGAEFYTKLYKFDKEQQDGKN